MSMRFERYLEEFTQVKKDVSEYYPTYKDQTEVIKFIKLLQIFKTSTLNINEFEISFNSISPNEQILSTSDFLICKVKYKHLPFANIVSSNVDTQEVTIQYDNYIISMISMINPSLEILSEKIELRNSFELFESSIDHLEEVRNSIANFWV